MSIDPVTAAMTAKELVTFAKTFSEKIPGNKQENSLRFECSNNLGIHTSHRKVDGKISKWINSLTHGSLVVPASNFSSVKMFGYSPFPEMIRGNVKREGERLIIDLKPALKFDLFSIEVGYKMDPEFLRGLVHARAPSEVFGEGVKYRLSAQLKNPEGLQLDFSEIEIEEFPVTARVHLTEKINSHVPEYVKELTIVERELLDDRNPHRDRRLRELDKKRVRLLKRLGKASLEDKVQELTQLLTDKSFTRFVQVQDDFNFDRCEKSTEFFRALGMFQLPKFMNVISRTDLNLKKNAATGVLIYDSKKFEAEIDNLF